MTKREIQSLIDSNLSGQGNQVDLGNALPSIFGGILGKISEVGGSFLSLERVRPYLYRITFDSLPQDKGVETSLVGGCSSYISEGKLYRNLDFNYDDAASFIVRTKDFEGMSFITGLNDGELSEELINQLPYQVVDGRNNNGIMVSTHILFNDWEWEGVGDKNIPLTRLPFLALSNIKSMATIEEDMEGVLENLYVSPRMGEYLLQVMVSDGETTYAILPPMAKNEPFVLQDITSNPKLTNFRWVEDAIVERGDLQRRPTGVERFNLMPCKLSDLAFTKAYESPNWLSEFIGIEGTTKDSTDEQLTTIYNKARAKYLERTRNGETWQTMHSVVYGTRMEELYIQERWDDDCLGVASIENQIGDLATLETDHKSTLVEAINEVFDVVETEEMVISMAQSYDERKAIYNECILHPHIAKNIVFHNVEDGYYYRVNGYKATNNLLFLHTIMIDGQGVRSVAVQLASNGSLAVA